MSWQTKLQPLKAKWAAHKAKVSQQLQQQWETHGQPRWQGLNSREQLILKVGGVVAVIAVLYYAIWSPITQAVAEAEQRVQTQQQLLSWVTTQTARYEALAGGKNVTSGAASRSSLTQRFTRIAQQNNIQVARTQPQDNELNVVIDEVNFNQLLALLNQLETQANIGIVQLDVAEAGAPGQVRVRRLRIRD